MKKSSTHMTTHALLAVALLTVGFAGSALAESPCKGLEQRQCGGNCIWVDGYVRKDGIKVAAYCKSSGKSSGSSSSEDKKVETEEKKSSTKDK